MRAINFGGTPLKSRKIQFLKEGRRKRHRMRRRTMIMQKPRREILRTSSTATNCVRSFEHGDVAPCASEARRRGKAVWATANDNRCAHYVSCA